MFSEQISPKLPLQKNDDYLITFLDKLSQAAAQNAPAPHGVKLRLNETSVTAYSGMALDRFTQLEGLFSAWFGAPTEREENKFRDDIEGIWGPDPSEVTTRANGGESACQTQRKQPRLGWMDAQQSEGPLQVLRPQPHLLNALSVHYPQDHTHNRM
jgi:hypothetical protein